MTRLGPSNSPWWVAFIDQTGIVPGALSDAKTYGLVPRRVHRHLEKLIPAKWVVQPIDRELSALTRIALQTGVIDDVE